MRLHAPARVHDLPMLVIAVVGLARERDLLLPAPTRRGRELERRAPRIWRSSPTRSDRSPRDRRRRHHPADPVALGRSDRRRRDRALHPAAHLAPRRAGGAHPPAKAAPAHIDVRGAPRRLWRRLPGVVDVHDLHVWTLTSDMEVASAHLMIAKDADTHRVLDSARAMLRLRYKLEHATLQVEPEDSPPAAPSSSGEREIASMSAENFETSTWSTRCTTADRGYPHPLWTRLRREDPVHWFDRSDGLPFWAITRHAGHRRDREEPGAVRERPPADRRAPSGAAEQLPADADPARSPEARHLPEDGEQRFTPGDLQRPPRRHREDREGHRRLARGRRRGGGPATSSRRSRRRSRSRSSPGCSASPARTGTSCSTGRTARSALRIRTIREEARRRRRAARPHGRALHLLHRTRRAEAQAARGRPRVALRAARRSTASRFPSRTCSPGASSSSIAGNETTRNATSGGMLAPDPAPAASSASSSATRRCCRMPSRRSSAGRARSSTSRAPRPRTPRSAAS